MALKPIWVWKLAKDGRPLLDKKGKRIPHSKRGQPKRFKDYSDAEMKTFERQVEFDKKARLRSAQLVMAPIEKAESLLRDN